jgi:hypothetical protein
MNRTMKRTVQALLGSALLLGTAPAFAQNPNLIDTTRVRPTELSGSDTLNKVMDEVLLGLGSAASGITKYEGCGSSCGERQLRGTPSSSEPACTPADASSTAELNPGCQEISPMSRELQSGICGAGANVDDPNIEGGLTINDQAEGFAMCSDGIVIIANNNSLGAFGDDAAACTAFHASATTPNTGNTFVNNGVGRLRTSGSLSTGTPITSWKDVIRLVYTGCTPGQTAAACAATDRVTRCGGADRTALINNWGDLFQGVACTGSAGCAGGLRHAYRRDDASGTTGVFLELLGVAFNAATNLASRTSLITGTIGPVITAMPANLSFCDGGQVEGMLPTHIGAVSAPFPAGQPLYTNGDPIRKPCAADDDLCGADGSLGVVRAIRSTDTIANPYPTHQCQRLFDYNQFINTALPVCPDRTKPSAGRCKFPYYASGSFKTFNCLTSQRQSSPSAPTGTDGRSYNYVVHDTTPAGTILFSDGSTRRMPYTAMFRQNMANLNNSALFSTGTVFGPSDYVCTESDATRNIGCLTSKSRCTIGYAGREAAFNAGQTAHLDNEPALIDGIEPSNANINSGAYKFSRYLWMNAIRGFENIMLDCVDRGGTQAYCEAQVAIAQEFLNVGQPGNRVTTACTNAGYIPLPAAICRGAATSATCGAPATPADCTIDTRSFASLTNRNN